MIASSLLAPWAAYLLGEQLHVSGVIATVATELICGWTQHTVFSAAVRMRGGSFWNVMIFLMEAMVFMLIGFSLRGVVEHVGGFGGVLQEMAIPVTLVLMALTLARFAWVFDADAVTWVLQRAGLKRATPLGAPCDVVLSWAGMRGVVILAVALPIP